MNWTQLVAAARERHMSTWRLGEIAQVVKDADSDWNVQVQALSGDLRVADGARAAAESERDAAREMVTIMERAFRDLWDHPEFPRGLFGWVEDFVASEPRP